MINLQPFLSNTKYFFLPHALSLVLTDGCSVILWMVRSCDVYPVNTRIGVHRKSRIVNIDQTCRLFEATSTAASASTSP